MAVVHATDATFHPSAEELVERILLFFAVQLLPAREIVSPWKGIRKTSMSCRGDRNLSSESSLNESSELKSARSSSQTLKRKTATDFKFFADLIHGIFFLRSSTFSDDRYLESESHQRRNRIVSMETSHITQLRCDHRSDIHISEKNRTVFHRVTSELTF